MMLNTLKGKSMSTESDWIPSLQAESKEKNAKFQARLADASKESPMNHWRALSVIKPILE